MTRHSCLHTSRLRSKGVSKNLSRSCSLGKLPSERVAHKASVLTPQALSAIGGRPPFPGVLVVPGLWIWSMVVFSGPVNVVCFRSVSLRRKFLPPLKVDRDSEMRLLGLEESSRFGALAVGEPKRDRMRRKFTCCKFGACQLRGIQEFVQIPFLSDRLKTRGCICVCCVLIKRLGAAIGWDV